jgi:hypothetical protein
VRSKSTQSVNANLYFIFISISFTPFFILGSCRDIFDKGI